MQAIEILDLSMTLRGEVTQYKSLRLRRRFSGVGDFELVLPLHHPMAERLKRDRLLVPAGQPNKAMMIEQVKKTEGSDMLNVKGYTLSGLLKRRICVPPSVSDSQHFGYDRIRSDAETLMRHYVENNLVHPESAARMMPEIELEAVNQHRGTQDVPWSARFEQLDEVLAEIGAYCDAGYAIIPDFERKKLVFTFLTGRDKTGIGCERVMFSTQMGNVFGTEMTENAQQMKNAALVGGAGEDEKRVIFSVCPNGETGIARRECFVDAGSRTTVHELQEEGLRRLEEKKLVQTIRAEVMDTVNCRYGQNWDLGDRVIVSAYGAKMTARITQIQESYESGRVRLEVTFGTPPKGIEQLIGGRMRGMAR